MSQVLDLVLLAGVLMGAAAISGAILVVLAVLCLFEAKAAA